MSARMLVLTRWRVALILLIYSDFSALTVTLLVGCQLEHLAWKNWDAIYRLRISCIFAVQKNVIYDSSVDVIFCDNCVKCVAVLVIFYCCDCKWFVCKLIETYSATLTLCYYLASYVVGDSICSQRWQQSLEDKASSGEFDSWHHVARCWTTVAVQWQLCQTWTCLVSL